MRLTRFDGHFSWRALPDSETPAPVRPLCPRVVTYEFLSHYSPARRRRSGGFLMATLRSPSTGTERLDSKHLPAQVCVAIRIRESLLSRKPTAINGGYAGAPRGSTATRRNATTGEGVRTLDPYLGNVGVQFCIREGVKMPFRPLLTPNFHGVPR